MTRKEQDEYHGMMRMVKAQESIAESLKSILIELQNLGNAAWTAHKQIIMRFKNSPESDTNGCSFHGSTIVTSVAVLREEIGAPVVQSNTGEDKINFMWVCELEDGEVFTLYDWKEYRPISENETIEFNIGAKTPWESTEAEYALQYL